MQQDPQNPYPKQASYPDRQSYPQAAYPDLTSYPKSDSAFYPQQAAYPNPPVYPPQTPYPQAPYPGQVSYPPQTGYPQQQMYAGTPIPAPLPNVMQNTVNVNGQTGHSHGLLIRALYFICIGWWLGFFWLNLGFAFCTLIITLPLGLAMLNRLPQVLTLRSPSAATTNVSVSTVAVAGMGGAASFAQTVNVTVNTNNQHNFLLRALYFLLVGWWAGYLWACLGYCCCISVVLLPVGLMMLNRLPAVLTLRKN
jgi:uncharacterized membrane protein YccF (DUF307 family)